ncbi:MAG: nitroreductase [Weeksellaceae bacterium]|nr:nitroreductase [Weeksellaceae bacterium]
MSESRTLKDIIQRRRSVYPKDYSQEKVEESVIEEILRSAEYAPNHKKTQPWRIKVFRDEKKEQLGQKIGAIYRENTSDEDFLQKKQDDLMAKVEMADTVLAICVNFSGKVPEWEEIAATAMSVQNMYLTCTAHGIGSYWGTPGFKDQMDDFLELEENQKCLGFFYLGKIQGH